MGTIRCGFWKLRFLLSPESMKEWLELCKEHNICFEIPNTERTKHTGGFENATKSWNMVIPLK